MMTVCDREPFWAGQEIFFKDTIKKKWRYGVITRMVGFQEPYSYAVGIFDDSDGDEWVFDLRFAQPWTEEID